MAYFQTIVDSYDYIFYQAGDPRVQQWSFLGSPLPIVSVIVAYLYIVLVAGPKFMENRKPHSLKKIIAAYNIFQLFANSVIIYGMLTSGWANHLDFGCHLPDFSNHPTALRMAAMVWYEMCLKLIDFIETVSINTTDKTSLKTGWVITQTQSSTSYSLQIMAAKFNWIRG
uniref:Elongation of very long chain fatty acids protein n=1 Tax=Timema bartmani TaxID=61472 RepID=A0A7R9I3B3_9NEOP|nr:unnamed protein product [Timema bartmani]